MGSCIKSGAKDAENRSTAIIQSNQKAVRAAEHSTHSKDQFSQEEQKLGTASPNRKLQAKKKAPVAGKRLQRDGPTDAPSAVVTEAEISAKDYEEIKKSLTSHFIFNSLAEENLELIISEMRYFTLGAKELIFSQGDPGNNFFIVATGKVEIVINNKIKGYITKGGSFGELALVHDAPRTATIRTSERCALWGLERESFRAAVQSISEKKYIENKRFIDSVPMFTVLTEVQKEALLAALVPLEFKNNEKIVVEGDPGEALYLIKAGVVRCTRRGQEIRRMDPGEFFGEQALLYNTPRTATIYSTGNTHILSLGREHLADVLGDQLQKILYKNSQRIALERSEVLRSLTKAQIDAILDRTAVSVYEPGQIVIPEGDPKGTKLLIVLKGGIQCSSALGELKVFDVVGDSDLLLPPQGFFTEDFTATEETILAEIPRTELEFCIGGALSSIASNNEMISVLKRVQLLRALPTSTIERLAAVLSKQNYNTNEVIFAQNDPGETFCIVQDGQVDIAKDGVYIRTIVKNDYFGERAILLNENRTASARAKTPATLWVLNRQDFLNLVEEGTRAQLLRRMDLQNDRVALEDLKAVKVLGKGMFGNVLLLASPAAPTVFYALKTVPRTKILAYELYENLVLERQILLQLDHPLIMKLVKTFKDSKRLYFLMEFVRGMDLFDVLRVLNLLKNDSSQFYTACLILILEHLHERAIIYRDLKPENIMIDDEGYPKLIDFGTAKIISGRTYTVVGTPHYMAPEVILGKGYGLSADYWSVGIILYEFICGYVPFGEEEEDPFRIYGTILDYKLVYPSYIGSSVQAKPLINQLLSKNPVMRGNYETIKEHPWLAGIDWDKILGKQLKPPYIPSLSSLATEVASALKKDNSPFDLAEAEERKEPIDAPRHKQRAPPPGWDDDF